MDKIDESVEKRRLALKKSLKRTLRKRGEPQQKWEHRLETHEVRRERSGRQLDELQLYHTDATQMVSGFSSGIRGFLCDGRLSVTLKLASFRCWP